MKQRNFDNFSQLFNLFLAAADITVCYIRLLFHLQIVIRENSRNGSFR